MPSSEGRLIEISGWGHAQRLRTRVQRPELLRDLREAVRAGGGIARGLGRSYGDAALSRQGVFQLSRLSRLLHFTDDGLLTAEAGVSLGEILRVFGPRGWTLPVTPGTQFVTLGGAIASDVHGKNHHVAGSFGRHVAEIALLAGDGELRRLRPESDPALFFATLGGMGLTGVIVEATLRLRPAETGYVRVDYARSQSLGETLDWFAAHDRDYPYTVAWIDGLGEGRNLGRAVLMGGRDALRAELPRGTRPFPDPAGQLPVPPGLPSGLLGRGTGLLFNALYYHLHRPRSGAIEPLWKFFYPLDVARDWYRLYGPRGFAQYQAVFPPAVGERELRGLLGRIHRARHANFLGVLKRMGDASPGPLAFPMPGLTLALDLPVLGERTRDLFAALYAETADLGGRIYLTKDSALSPALFRRMYPRAAEFLQLKAQIDPEQRFTSLLAERLGLEVRA